MNKTNFIELATSGFVDDMIPLIEKNPKILLEKGQNSETALHWAAYNDEDEMAILLISESDKLDEAKGMDIDHKDKKGNTALMIAAERGCFAVVKILLAAGADIKIQQKDGLTAKDVAASSVEDKTLKANKLKCLKLIENAEKDILPTRAEVGLPPDPNIEPGEAKTGAKKLSKQ